MAGAGGVVVAGIAASGATVSPFFPEGVDPRVVSADGRDFSEPSYLPTISSTSSSMNSW